jgi:hypothetical protein
MQGRRWAWGGRGLNAAEVTAAVALGLILGLTAPTPASGDGSRWEWDGIARVVAVGDVHGRYDQLTSILRGTGLVDDGLRWTGAKDHLVLCGDLLDRGPDDRAVVDLVRRLEKEAKKAGGRVHVVLGNHEIMNLSRDFRYVRPGGYAAFEADEKDDDRKKAWETYEEAFSGNGTNATELREGFDAEYPPGYFARRRAFSRKGEYGSWLFERPTVVKVNGILFVHGGLTPEVAALGIDEINARVGESLGAFVDSADVLQGVMTTPGTFGELYGTAQHVVRLVGEGRSLDSSVVEAAEVLIAQVDELPFAPDGPQWYRGSSLNNERLERERMGRVLERLGAHTIMVGHTPTRTGRVSSRFAGRLIRGDVGLGYGRPGYAVVFENGDATVFDPRTGQASRPLVEPPYGEGWTGGSVSLTDAELEEYLSRAKIVARTEMSRGGLSVEIWELEDEGLKLRGVFKDIEEGPPSPERAAPRRYRHEVAAYELDRILDIGLVPVAVVREEEGRRGALRRMAETALDLVSIRTYQDLEEASAEETIRTVAEAYALDPEDLERQVIQARVFDGLIGNLDRPDVDTLIAPAEGRVVLVDQDEAFGLTTELDATLLSPCRPIPADLRIYLSMLNAEELQSDLGDSLTAAQIDAILKRRDRILELCGEPGG